MLIFYVNDLETIEKCLSVRLPSTDRGWVRLNYAKNCNFLFQRESNLNQIGNAF